MEQSCHVETICLLVLRNSVTHVNIDVDVEELVQDKRGAATYEQIRNYVKKQTGLNVSTLDIAQIKRNAELLIGRIIICRSRRIPSNRTVQKRRKKQ